MLYLNSYFRRVKIEWKNYPVDIIICLIWSIAIIPAVLLDIKALRIVLGLPFILFIPGYVLVFALFPGRDIDLIERIALSFGLSIAVVPLVGLALNYTPWGIRLEPILTSLIALVFILSIIGWYRWQSLPIMHHPLKKRRFFISIDLHLPKGESKMENVLTIVLIISILISISLLIYIIVTPRVGESFTEFYILGPNGKAEGYPTNLSVGENGTVIIGIVNHEHEVINYTVEIWTVNYSFYAKFDGKDDYIDCGKSDTFNLTKDITIETLVKPEDTQPWNFLGKSGSYILEINKQKIRFGIQQPDADEANENGYVIIAATGNFSGWNHVACTYNAMNREMHIYVNGYDMANITTTGGNGTISTSSSPLYIGKVWEKHFKGIIDYVRIYNMSLSPSELQQNYNENVTLKGLISEWKFNEGDGNVVHDKIGGNNGRIHGSIWYNSGNVTNMWFMNKIEVRLNSTSIDIEGEWKPQWEYNYSFNITKKGHFKIAFLLFKSKTEDFVIGNDYAGEADRISRAYRECHLWVVTHIPPKANFTYYPSNPATRDIITYRDCSLSIDGKIINWSWNFGDGNASYGKNALIFDGIDDHIDCGNDSSLDITNNCTIDFCFNPNGTRSTLIHKDGVYGIYFLPSKKALRLYDYAHGSFVDSNNIFEKNEWHHVTMVKSGKQVKWYKNGVMTSKGKLTDEAFAISNSSLYISSLNNAFNGAMTYLRIYNRALNDTEVENNYYGNITTNGLISWWKFDEGHGKIAHDCIGKNDGAIHGATWKNYAWHGYAAKGIYIVTLKVKDNNGAEDDISKAVKVT